MAIDTSIYNALRPAQIESPIDNYAKVAQLQQAQNQNRLADLMFGEKQREVNDANTLNQLYKSAVDPDGQIDRAKLYSGIAQGGLGAKLPGIQKSFADQDKSLLEAQKAKIETGLKQFDLIGQIMSGVKDQASYDIARQQAAQILGPENAAKIPAVYDPAEIERNKMQALSVKDQLEQRWKALDYQLNQDKFGEEKRHNQAAERNAAGQLAVSQGNLAVSRDRLSFEKSQPKGQIIQTEDGPMLADPRTGSAHPLNGPGGQPLPDKMQAKKQASARNLLPILDEADKLVDGATGSYIGYGADQAARAFGKVTEGAKNVAQLKVLEGNLMLNQPRMEGPQSDKDVMMYRQMAGQIGDPTVPREIKKAALSTIRKLAEKYAGTAQTVPTSVPSGWSVQEH